ncbi:MAG: alpha-L-fucosidase [Phycisphaerales bacterium]|nr:alpha-L-fucosidase [Phycisphaerales bacterium]
MSKSFKLPGRQVHLDFHTSPAIGDVGSDFNAIDFAKQMKSAHVNSVTLFAKCHHGHLYYNTNRPERHPGLKSGLNLLGEQVEALHKAGIRAPIYLSVLWDEYAAQNHPEWIAREVDGKPVGAGPLAAGWRVLDMSSPYQDYLADQTSEVLRLFKPVDGIFFDICWDQPSLNNYAIAKMVRQGFDPEIENDRKAYAHRVVIDYMRRFHKMVRDASPNATVYFNARPLANLAEEIQFLEQVEIEALPTGDWGYLYFPKNVRYVRTFDREYIGMTARFHKSWADFGGLKPYAALEYETSQMIAHGAKCSIGDQLHPRGTLDKAAYDLIGKAYAHIESAEPYTEGAKPITQIGLFQTSNDRFSAGTDDGTVRMLTQLKHQFDVVTPDSQLDRHELLILPEGLSIDEKLGKRLDKYLKAGGAILAAGQTGLNADATALTWKSLPIKPQGLSPYTTTTYIRFGKEVARDVPPTDHVMYERGIRVTPTNGASAVAHVVEPYFDRSWQHFSSHFQTPPDKVSKFAAAILSGRIGYIPYPIFSAFANHGNIPYRLLVRNMIQHLLGEPLLQVDGPSSLEATVMRQPTGRTIVHLLNYCPERRTPKLDLVEDIIPLFEVRMNLKLSKKPKQVYLAPQKTPLEFEYANGRVSLIVPKVEGHQMIAFE